MLSLSHPAVHRYKADKNRIKINVDEDFSALRKKSWRWQEFSELIKTREGRLFLLRAIPSRVKTIMADMCYELEIIESITFQHHSLIVQKRKNSTWEDAFKIINKVFDKRDISPKI